MKGKVQGLFRKSRGPETSQWDAGVAPPMPLNVQKNVNVSARPVTPPNRRATSGAFEVPLGFDDGSSIHRSPAPASAPAPLNPPILRTNQGGGLRANDRDSYITTMSDMMDRDRAGGSIGSGNTPLAGLPKKGQRKSIPLPPFRAGLFVPSLLRESFVHVDLESGDGFVPTPLTSAHSSRTLTCSPRQPKFNASGGMNMF